MATKVVMAQLSPTMEEGRLVEWKVDEGDEVEQGDIVAEIETDKANMEVEALGGGVLRKILVRAGETVPVGALIGVIADPDEDIQELVAGAEPASSGESAGEAAASGASEEAEAGAREEPAGEGGGGGGEARERTAVRRRAETGGASRETAPGADGRLRASPVARKMAEERGLDLASLSGSGPAGRIVKRDVEEALERGPLLRPPPAPGAGLEERTVEVSQMRKAIARRLAQSIGPVPHFFLTSEIDMERAMDLRADLNERLEAEGGERIGVNDLILLAAARALVEHPEINASWEGEEIRRFGRVDLGIAVALDEGLITPVLRGAERKGLRQIAAESRELVRRARARDLDPQEYQGATFTISNLGMFEIEEFTAIINPPESAILAVGRTSEKAVIVDGEVTARRRMRVTMSCDHRVIDGAMGARFLGTFKSKLENPLALTL